MKVLLTVLSGLLLSMACSDVNGEIVVFQDDYSDKRDGSDVLAQRSPRVGASYSGEGRLYVPGAQTEGSAALAAAAFEKKGFVHAPGATANGLRWNLGDDASAKTIRQFVEIAFSFYMVGGTGANGMSVMTFLDNEGTKNRSFTLALKDNGIMSWYDGYFHQVGERSPINEVVSFYARLDLAAGTFTAKVGPVSFEGNLVSDSHNDFFYDPSEAEHAAEVTLGNVIFITSTPVEFFLSDPRVSVIPRLP